MGIPYGLLSPIHQAIDYLLENPSFRLKLFSDSTSNAKEEKHHKVQNGKGKGILYGELALHTSGKQLTT